MRAHIRNIDEMPQVAGKKLLRALIVLQSALSGGFRQGKQEQGGQHNPPSTIEIHYV
jgi:hypothetical protein